MGKLYLKMLNKHYLNFQKDKGKYWQLKVQVFTKKNQLEILSMKNTIAENQC